VPKRKKALVGIIEQQMKLTFPLLDLAGLSITYFDYFPHGFQKISICIRHPAQVVSHFHHIVGF
jgi:hypothetical protein